MCYSIKRCPRVSPHCKCSKIADPRIMNHQEIGLFQNLPQIGPRGIYRECRPFSMETLRGAHPLAPIGPFGAYTRICPRGAPKVLSCDQPRRQPKVVLPPANGARRASHTIRRAQSRSPRGERLAQPRCPISAHQGQVSVIINQIPAK